MNAKAKDGRLQGQRKGQKRLEIVKRIFDQIYIYCTQEQEALQSKKKVQNDTQKPKI
jgi:hypothetical protein